MEYHNPYICLYKFSCLMLRFLLLVILAVSGTVFNSRAQRIVYSQTDRDDQKSQSFDIIGKISDHYLVIKSYRGYNSVYVFDGDMKLVEKTDLDFLPDKVIATDILNYKDFFYLFYQYQKRNIVYFMAAKIDGNGKMAGEPMQLDTLAINFFASNRIYNIVNSDDKQKIMAFTISSKNSGTKTLKTRLFDAGLNLVKKSANIISIDDKNDFLTEFTVDNEGDFVFAKASGSSDNENINSVSFVTKKAQELYLNVFEKYPTLDDYRVSTDLDKVLDFLNIVAVSIDFKEILDEHDDIAGLL